MIENIVKEISEFVGHQGTLVQEEDFEQVPVHHLTTRDYSVDGDVILYIGKEVVFCESGGKYLYKELDNFKLKEILNIIS